MRNRPEILLLVGDGEKRIARLYPQFADVVEFEEDGDGNDVERSCFSMSYEEMEKILAAKPNTGTDVRFAE